MNAEALHNRTLGQRGEALAAAYLVAKGYIILERNYRAGHQELDLITRQDDILHFVEVKTREATQFGLGEDAMHKWKFERLLQAIDAYLARFEKVPEWQLDLIVIELKAKSAPQFIHYEAVGPIDVS